MPILPTHPLPLPRLSTARLLAAVLLTAGLSACAGIPPPVPAAAAPPPPPPAPECAGLPGSSMVEASLFFGRNIGGKVGVSERDWQRFVNEVVTPRFPDGLTVQNAAGQWRDTDTGAVVQEPSKVLILFIPPDPAALAKIKEVADAYKTRFRQQAVATVLQPSCIGF